MPVLVSQRILARSQRALAAILLLGLTACGGKDNSSPAASAAVAPSLIDINSGAVIDADNTVYALSQIRVEGVDLTDASLEFFSADSSSRPLIQNLTTPDHFWLPAIPTTTSGYLRILTSEGAPFSMPLTLVANDDLRVPGAVTQNFLQSSLNSINTAIARLQTDKRPLPELLQALSAARGFTEQMLLWVNGTMNRGEVPLASFRNGGLAIMTKDDLKMLDQVVLATAKLASNGSAPTNVTKTSGFKRFLDWLLPSAYAQTPGCNPNRSQAGIANASGVSAANDLAWCLAMVEPANEGAFSLRARITGEALELASDAATNIAVQGSASLRPGADVRTASLLLAGLYTAHYGNGLATVAALQQTNFSAPGQAAVQAALGTLMAGLVNEIQLPDLHLDAFAQNDPVAMQIGNMATSINNAAVENLVEQLILIYLARIAGVSFCPAGSEPVPDTSGLYVECAAL